MDLSPGWRSAEAKREGVAASRPNGSRPVIRPPGRAGRALVGALVAAALVGLLADAARAEAPGQPSAAEPADATSPAPARVAKACGEAGQPVCPLYDWMKSNLAAAALAKDAGKVAQGLDYVAAHAPPGYQGWTRLAQDGAEKARAGDLQGARASCRTCHDQFKALYRRERRDLPF